jgi:hypothetical protein
MHDRAVLLDWTRPLGREVRNIWVYLTPPTAVTHYWHHGPDVTV